MKSAHPEFLGWIQVTRSFYLTFDGRRCYCEIPELYFNGTAAQMIVQYRQGDQEAYLLVFDDGIHYSGAMGTDDDSRVDFELFRHNDLILLAGAWKCGGREGEWYIEGTTKNPEITR